jgi:NAD(P)-dependent dehydrogenase (short-subunit alcohol dehydrogenase family)
VVTGIRPGGIGQAATARLAKDGYSLVTCDVNAELGKRAVETVREQGGDVSFVEADVATEEGVGRVMDEVERVGGGRLDLVVCNAGSAGDPRRDNILDLTGSVFRSLLDNNLTSAFLTTQAALKRFMIPQGFGSVIYLGSCNGQRGLGSLGQFGYGSAKAGLSVLVSLLTAQFGSRIRFNLVRPSIIETDSENWQRRRATDPDWPRIEGQYTPAGRLGRPEDVAAAIAWLASDAASFMAGIELPVDGGLAAAGIQHPAWNPANFRQSYVDSARSYIIDEHKVA